MTEAGGLLRLAPRKVAFGEDSVSTYTLTPGADAISASAVITRRYETVYEVGGGGGGAVWRSVVETASEMRDHATDPNLIELRHKLRVYEALEPEGSPAPGVEAEEQEEEDTEHGLSLFWEKEWQGLAPSQAGSIGVTLAVAGGRAAL
eukprot:SAG22_NODE_261_length_13373_cov_17.745472_11_plen_148_part_00